MAVTEVQDRIVSTVRDDPLSDIATSVLVNSEFTKSGSNISIPSEGYLLIGDVVNLSASNTGEIPNAELVKYDGYTRNGDGTTTFESLTRGVAPYEASTWQRGTEIGIAITAQVMNTILNSLTPQNNGTTILHNLTQAELGDDVKLFFGQFSLRFNSNTNQLVLTDETNSIDIATIPKNKVLNELFTPGGIHELDIRDWYEKAESGTIEIGNGTPLFITELADGEEIQITQASFVQPDGTAIPSGCDVIIATLDGTGSGTSQVTVLSGDGSTIYDKERGAPLGSYTNSSGGTQEIMVGIDNGQWNTGSGSDVQVQLSSVAKVI